MEQVVTFCAVVHANELNIVTLSSRRKVASQGTHPHCCSTARRYRRDWQTSNSSLLQPFLSSLWPRKLSLPVTLFRLLSMWVPFLLLVCGLKVPRWSSANFLSWCKPLLSTIFLFPSSLKARFNGVPIIGSMRRRSPFFAPGSGSVTFMLMVWQSFPSMRTVLKLEQTGNCISACSFPEELSSLLKAQNGTKENALWL